MKTKFFTECEDWTRLNFLNFRQKEENWTANKMREHNTYVRTLGMIAGNSSNKQQSVALSAWKIFPVIVADELSRSMCLWILVVSHFIIKRAKQDQQDEESTYKVLDDTRSYVIEDAKVETRKRKSIKANISEIPPHYTK
ncbi:hypothetical protein GLOIN_2v1739297 [Rhizophagus clarus]|uniref:Uncharacterized protein n=1 Tax=Rhizophagus clarus TaxID=94130 RepID=A0A8H3KXC0_9GLOM|nr:hypothetical protein GLOIN_2v1739297 [Rhizophagus clarus]